MKQALHYALLIAFAGTTSFAAAQYPKNGLIAWYQMNGNAKDSSGNDLHGIESGNIAPAADRFGNLNSALYFDGSDDFIRVKRDSLLEPSVVSVCVWVKPEVTPTYHYNVIVTKRMYHASDPGNSYILDAGGTATQNKYYFGIANDTVPGSHRQLDGHVQWTNHTDWDFLTGVYDGQTMKLYINGQFDTSYAFSGTIGYTAYDLFIGSPSFPLQFLYKGKMDELAIYNRALSAEEVQNMYSSSSAINSSLPENDLVVYPNPAFSELNLSVGSETTPVRILVTDSKGSLVLDGSFSENLDISSLAEGVYHLQIVYEAGNKSSRKFLKIR